jgi:hypothetical protein
LRTEKSGRSLLCVVVYVTVAKLLVVHESILYCIIIIIIIIIMPIRLILNTLWSIVNINPSCITSRETKFHSPPRRMLTRMYNVVSEIESQGTLWSPEVKTRVS